MPEPVPAETEDEPAGEPEIMEEDNVDSFPDPEPCDAPVDDAEDDFQPVAAAVAVAAQSSDEEEPSYSYIFPAPVPATTRRKKPRLGLYMQGAGAAAKTKVPLDNPAPASSSGVLQPEERGAGNDSYPSNCTEEAGDGEPASKASQLPSDPSPARPILKELKEAVESETKVVGSGGRSKVKVRVRFDVSDSDRDESDRSRTPSPFLSCNKYYPWLYEDGDPDEEKELQDPLKNTSDDFEGERLTNMQAAAVFVKDAPIAQDEDDSFELCYNTGCQLLTKEDWVNAEKVLLTFTL